MLAECEISLSIGRSWLQIPAMHQWILYLQNVSAHKHGDVLATFHVLNAKRGHVTKVMFGRAL